jgi:hypothetical protein
VQQVKGMVAAEAGPNTTAPVAGDTTLPEAAAMPPEPEAAMPQEGLASPVEKDEEMPSERIDPEKAKQILSEGEAQGQALTGPQEGMFGAAAGKEEEKEKNSKCADDMSDDELEEYVRARKIGRYATEGTAADAEAPSGSGTVDTQAARPTDGSAEEQYEKDEQEDDDVSKKEQYGETGHRLKDLEAEVAKLKKEVETERALRINAERYSKLADRRQHFVLNLDKEKERCRYGRMSDEQFDDHLQTIEDNYQRIPVGETLSLHGRGVDAAVMASMPHSEAEKLRYSKEDSAEAVKLCVDKAGSGEGLSFEAALAEVQARRNGGTK